ncbi:hypothetical protein [Thermococcus sp.]
MRILELTARRKTGRPFLPERPSMNDLMNALRAAKETPSGFPRKALHRKTVPW